MIKKILNNPYILSVLSKVSAISIALLFTVFFNRYLGVELRGAAAVILNYATILSLVFGFGIYQEYANIKAKNDES
ncbi:MAG: hypothetical protein RG740_07380, partial [Acholeplasmataceae bacterium]|nr:hypothetical protein [Acholeplasmataceae bacterium]